MGRGLISGLFWGGVLSLGVAGMLSLGTALPERPVAAAAAVPVPNAGPDRVPVPAPDAMPDAMPTTVAPDVALGPQAGQQGAEGAAPSDAIPLPAGSEFNRQPAEVAPALPAPDTAPETAPQSGTLAPEQSVLPAFNTASAPRPVASAEIERPNAAAPAPAQGPAEVATDSASAIATAPVVETAPIALNPVVPGPVGSGPAVSGLPQIESGPVAQAEPAAISGFARPDSLFVEAQPEQEGDDDGAAAMALNAAGNGGRPAIEAHAMAFEPADDRPLMAVILIDDPSFPLGRSALTRFDFPVTFAIDPTREGATEAAAEYRAAGFEVMLLATSFEGADTAMAEALWPEGLAIVPQAVAVLDTDQGALQRNRHALEVVVEAMAQTGHGLVAFPRGLNVAEQRAARASVPAATLFREIDGERERATVITRYLDRAAFVAGQEGRVIVVGHTYSDTVTALFSWALGGRSEGVALAPVSAVLTH